MPNADAAAPFAGLRVVELASDPAGELAARFFAHLGADVVKIEPPGGSASREIGPFAGELPGAERSLNFWFYNTGKRSAVLDLESKDGRDAVLGLVAEADLLVHTMLPREAESLGLGWETLRSHAPALIVCAVTPFGQDGPWAEYRSSDLIALAAGGPLNSCGYDDLSIPPVRPGGNQAYHTAATFATNAVLLALLERQQTGEGRFIDVSMHESMAVTVELANPYWFYNRALVRRQTCRPAMPMLTQPALLLCSDGAYVYLALIIGETKPWKSLVAWMGEHGMALDLGDPVFENSRYRKSNFGYIQGVLESFAAVLDSYTFAREGQERGLPTGRVNAPGDLLDDEQLVAREFFVEVDQPGFGPVKHPGAPFRSSRGGWAITRPAPALGQHTEEVLGETRGVLAGQPSLSER